MGSASSSCAKCCQIWPAKHCTMYYGQSHILHVSNAQTSPPLITEDLSGAAAALQDSLNVSILISPFGSGRTGGRGLTSAASKLYYHKVLAHVSSYYAKPCGPYGSACESNMAGGACKLQALLQLWLNWASRLNTGCSCPGKIEPLLRSSGESASEHQNWE